MLQNIKTALFPFLYSFNNFSCAVNEIHVYDVHTSIYLGRIKEMLTTSSNYSKIRWHRMHNNQTKFHFNIQWMERDLKIAKMVGDGIFWQLQKTVRRIRILVLFTFQPSRLDSAQSLTSTNIVHFMQFEPKCINDFQQRSQS